MLYHRLCGIVQHCYNGDVTFLAVGKKRKIYMLMIVVEIYLAAHC